MWVREVCASTVATGGYSQSLWPREIQIITKGPGFDPYWGHQVVSLSKKHLLPRVLVNNKETVALSQHD